MSSRKHLSRKKRLAKKPFIDFEKVLQPTKVIVDDFRQNKCPNVGGVLQSEYFRDGKLIEAKRRGNGSRSLNTFTNCRMTKKERQEQRKLYSSDPELMPTCNKNQQPIVGYIRFDSYGNPYKVKGVCRDVKIAQTVAEKTAAEAKVPDVNQFVGKMVETSRTLKKKKKKGVTTMAPAAQATIKVKPQLVRVKSESGLYYDMPALESVERIREHNETMRQLRTQDQEFEEAARLRAKLGQESDEERLERLRREIDERRGVKQEVKQEQFIDFIANEEKATSRFPYARRSIPSLRTPSILDSLSLSEYDPYHAM